MFTDVGAGGNGTCRSLSRYEYLKQVGCPGHFNIALYFFWLHRIKASSDFSLSFRNSPTPALCNLKLPCFPSNMCHVSHTAKLKAFMIPNMWVPAQIS